MALAASAASAICVRGCSVRGTTPWTPRNPRYGGHRITAHAPSLRPGSLGRSDRLAAARGGSGGPSLLAPPATPATSDSGLGGYSRFRNAFVQHLQRSVPELALSGGLPAHPGSPARADPRVLHHAPQRVPATTQASQLRVQFQRGSQLRSRSPAGALT
jgi:hypothetical protein